MTQDITTIPALRRAIKAATAIYIQPRFGHSEMWLNITKKEALRLIENYADDETPEVAGIYGGAMFAIAEDDGTLSIG